jgi:hypothetical protein
MIKAINVPSFYLIQSVPQTQADHHRLQMAKGLLGHGEEKYPLTASIPCADCKRAKEINPSRITVPQRSGYSYYDRRRRYISRVGGVW